MKLIKKYQEPSEGVWGNLKNLAYNTLVNIAEKRHSQKALGKPYETKEESSTWDRVKKALSLQVNAPVLPSVTGSVPALGTQTYGSTVGKELGLAGTGIASLATPIIGSALAPGSSFWMNPLTQQIVVGTAAGEGVNLAHQLATGYNSVGEGVGDVIEHFTGYNPNNFSPYGIPVGSFLTELPNLGYWASPTKAAGLFGLKGSSRPLLTRTPEANPVQMRNYQITENARDGGRNNSYNFNAILDDILASEGVTDEYTYDNVAKVANLLSNPERLPPVMIELLQKEGFSKEAFRRNYRDYWYTLVNGDTYTGGALSPQEILQEFQRMGKPEEAVSIPDMVRNYLKEDVLPRLLDNLKESGLKLKDEELAYITNLYEHPELIDMKFGYAKPGSSGWSDDVSGLIRFPWYQTPQEITMAHEIHHNLRGKVASYLKGRGYTLAEAADHPQLSTNYVRRDFSITTPTYTPKEMKAMKQLNFTSNWLPYLTPEKEFGAVPSGNRYVYYAYLRPSLEGKYDPKRLTQVMANPVNAVMDRFNTWNGGYDVMFKPMYEAADAALQQQAANGSYRSDFFYDDIMRRALEDAGYKAGTTDPEVLKKTNELIQLYSKRAMLNPRIAWLSHNIAGLGTLFGLGGTYLYNNRESEGM